MITAILVFAIVALFAAFGGGYALGYNVAKHPDKVEQQFSDAVNKVVK